MSLGHLQFEHHFSSELSQDDWLSESLSRNDGSLVLAGHTTGKLGQEKIGLCDGFIIQINQTGDIEVIDQFGTESTDYLYALSNTPSISSILIGGCTDGEMAISSGVGGNFDIWMGSYDLNSHSFQWKIQFGSIQRDWVYSLDSYQINDLEYWVGAGGGTLGELKGVPKGNHDIWFGVFHGLTGEVKWVKQIGSPVNDWLYKVLFNPASSHLLVGGVTKGDLVGKNKGSSDVWVGMYDLDGVKKWVVQFGTKESDFLQSISVSEVGDIFVAGYTGGTFLESSSSSSIPVGSTSSYVAKLNSENGDILWLTQYPNNGHCFDYLHRMEFQLQSRSLFIAGSTKPAFAVQHRALSLITNSTASSTPRIRQTTFPSNKSMTGGRRRRRRRMVANDGIQVDEEGSYGIWVAQLDVATGNRNWVERIPNENKIELNTLSLTSPTTGGGFLSVGGSLVKLVQEDGSLDEKGEGEERVRQRRVSEEGDGNTLMWYSEYQLPSLPSSAPIPQPSYSPTYQPTSKPSSVPIPQPSYSPTYQPTSKPSSVPIPAPTTPNPTLYPTYQPTFKPTYQPTYYPSSIPLSLPTSKPHIKTNPSFLLNQFGGDVGLINIDFYSIVATGFGILLLVVSWFLQKRWVNAKRNHGICSTSLSGIHSFDDSDEDDEEGDERTELVRYSSNQLSPTRRQVSSSSSASSSSTNSSSYTSSRYRFSSESVDEDEDDNRLNEKSLNQPPTAMRNNQVVSIEPKSSSLLPRVSSKEGTNQTVSNDEVEISAPFLELEYETETDISDDDEDETPIRYSV